ncbi:MAG: hypothetical protein M0C28_30790 [Candidatus Moduliflexus flocculans]|nr:hypothetical protein [Candidatus Moduliflexus flocculans]
MNRYSNQEDGDEDGIRAQSTANRCRRFSSRRIPKSRSRSVVREANILRHKLAGISKVRSVLHRMRKTPTANAKHLGNPPKDTHSSTSFDPWMWIPKRLAALFQLPAGNAQQAGDIAYVCALYQLLQISYFPIPR